MNGFDEAALSLMDERRDEEPVLQRNPNEFESIQTSNCSIGTNVRPEQRPLQTT
jgi:hypothetical protein